MNNTILFIRENYKPLLTSFFLALLLWIAVTTDKTYTMQIEVPLTISRLAEGYVLRERPPQKLVLEVSGKGRALFGLYFIKTALKLELPEIDRSKTIHLKDYQKRFNIARELGITIVDIVEPKTLRLEVDRYAEMKKPIKIISQINPLPGYSFVSMSSDHDSTLVSGPASIVRAVKFITSEPISRSGLKYPFQAHVNLKEPKPGITHLQPSAIDILFNIEEIGERTLYNIPIQMLGIPPEFLASGAPPTVNVRVSGGESKISVLTAKEITAVFDYQKYYKPGKLIYPVDVETPKDIELLEVIPPTFRLQLKRREDSR